MDAQYPGTATKIDAVQKDPISLPPSKKGASPGSTASENDDKASANLKDAENNDVIVKRDNDVGNIEEDD